MSSDPSAAAIPVTLPAMGESVTEGTLVEWRKQAGETVDEGEVIADVTTDKVDVEVTAPAAGVLSRITAQAGETVAVGAVIAEISAADGAGGGAAAPSADGAGSEQPADGAGATGTDAAGGQEAPSPEEGATTDGDAHAGQESPRAQQDATAAADDAAGVEGADEGDAAAEQEARPPAQEAQPAAQEAPAATAGEDAGAGEEVQVTLPPMGESVTEGTVARWLKQVGEQVSANEPLVEVTTDKVDVEVPSPAAGRLASIAAEEGATVEVGAVLAVIAAGAAGEGAAAPQGGSQPASGKAEPRTEPEGDDGASSAGGDAEQRGEPAASAAEQGGAPDEGGRRAASPPAPAAATSQQDGNGAAPSRPDVAASPLARRAAAIAGIDLAHVRGTGPGGLIRTGDVSAAAAQPAAPAPPQGAPGPAPDTGGAGPTARQRPTMPSAATPPQPGTTQLKGPLAALAGFMEQSRDIPTATSFRTLEVDVLDARRRALNAAIRAAGRPEKVSFTHLIGYAIVRAACDVPSMSSHFERNGEGKPLKVQGGVHLGLAVDTERKDGTRFLIVPVIRDAAVRDFASFRDEYERLVAKSRNGTLTADELRGATITLTNPGGIGTVASVPRLMPGQGTIVACGAIGYPPGLRGMSETRLRDHGISRVMTMTSTYDHRVIQGAESGEYLRRIEELLHGADGFYESVFASLGLAPPAGAGTAAETAAATAGDVGVAGAGRSQHDLLAAVAGGMSLVRAFRTHGHLGAHLDPLGTPPLGDPSMDPETVGLTPALMDAVPADVLRTFVAGRTLSEILPRLREVYCGTVAYEIEHISSHEQRMWLRERIEAGTHRRPLSPERKVQLLQRLTKVDAMERYFRRAFLGQKTFSIEGLDAMVPMLEELLGMVADDGIGEVVLGMAHRGRLAVTAHVVNRPYESLLVAFERGEQRRRVGLDAGDPTGDVKYHLGATGTYITETAKAITVRLLPNPSHLEAVDSVVEGWTRAAQTRRTASTLHVDPTAALPVLIHGDAAFPGQGVVAEVLNLESLQGYATGGTVHVIANNQVGFTTDPIDARSTRYASDLAKGFDVPIIHVNADDLEATIHAMRLAYEYRRTFHRDVVIDLIGYRRFGHNEADEPAYTQPLMYGKVRSHPTVREIFAGSLVEDGLITREDADERAQVAYDRVAQAHQKVKASLSGAGEEPPVHSVSDHEERDVRTGVPADALLALNEQLLHVPDTFHLHPKLIKQMDRRRETIASGEIDWGASEALAFASLLQQGRPIRLTGQDTERGTFSHRHLVFHDVETGSEWTPIHHIVGATATFELHNSPLSEAGALGFEYGYSAAAPEVLVLWEAQFGDFVNNAQVVVDQFIASGMAKWGLQSRLTLLLPHGYEGAGPEHSSARLERFLQLSSHGHMRVANCSTAAQYFHLLRQQALTPQPRPLVIMTPKSLLRARGAGATLEELSKGRFRRLIDDAVMSERRKDVRTLLLCSGKIYYDLVGHRLREEARDTAIVRIELLDPFPIEELLRLVGAYSNVRQIFWVQEEPSNMGAWNHLAHRVAERLPYELRWDYIGRPRRASPSEGFSGAHLLEQERIITTALTASTTPPDHLEEPSGRSMTS